MDTSQNLTYYNGQIQMTYGKNPAIKFTFECNQEITARDTGLTCEKKNEKLYECNWQTPIACRPMINVQCSIRDENGNADTQYDYLSLSKNDRNWQARVLGPNIEDAAYFINVCRTVILKGVAKYCSPTAGVCMVKGYVHIHISVCLSVLFICSSMLNLLGTHESWCGPAESKYGQRQTTAPGTACPTLCK